MLNNPNIIAFILAGGSGTRLAPLSLNFEGKLPKQFLKLLSDKTMFQETLDLFPEEVKKATVSLEKFRSVIEEQGQGRVDILAEPFGCNTAIAIGLGAVYALHKTGDENTVLFFKPSDHYIEKEYFTEYFYTACEQAKKNKIVLLGINPTRPETGLGYIKTRELDEMAEGGIGVHKIDCFVEKPNLEKAKEYLKSGQFYWNSGMFAFTTKFLLEKLKVNSPEIYSSLMKIKRAFDNCEGDPTCSLEVAKIILEEYQSIKDQNKNISIDYAVMEKEAEDILMVKVDGKLKWDDIGLWIAMERYFKPDENKNRTNSSNVSIDSCQNCLVLNYHPEQSIIISGLDDILVVNTENGILITPKSESIRAKDIVEDLKLGKKLIEIDSSGNNVANETETPVCLVGIEGLRIEADGKKLQISNFK